MYSCDTPTRILAMVLAKARLRWGHAGRSFCGRRASGLREPAREGTIRALSTSPGQASLAPSWKEEVNRRIAAHKGQKNSSVSQAQVTNHTSLTGTGSRAAEAAARVAARYAKAPSYSEMLAEEARGAVRAAEAASRAALEAQAVAEAMLASLEAASNGEQQWAPEVFHREARVEIPEQVCEQVWERDWEARTESAGPAASEMGEVDPLEIQPFGIRWDEDLPVRSSTPAETRALRGRDAFEKPEVNWRETHAFAAEALRQEGLEPESIQVVEPAPATHANLIEFPRELVATRKVRPRLAEGRSAIGPPAGQLSIFEVDPTSISTEPEALVTVSAAAPRAWQEPEWSGIELDAEPPMERAAQAAAVQAEAAQAAPALQLAPFGRRAMAAVVDGALITSAFLVGAVMVVGHVKTLPPMKEVEMASALALTVIAIVYHLLFFTLAAGTPGMKYARLSLCTFDDQEPTRAQMRNRLVAMLLSVLPLGLGVAWALFDEEHLSWHDRLSRTYLRRC